jgi:HKD family nuclease
MADLVYQDRLFRSRTAMALDALADPTVRTVRLAVAYTSREGCVSLLAALKRRLGRAWPTAQKSLITSFDFYLTDPDALDAAHRAGFDVYRGWSPAFAFHPKLYVLETASGDARVLVGSANLTEAAHNDNTEFGVTLILSAGSSELKTLDNAWERLVDTAQLLSPTDVARYRKDRARRAPKRRPTPARPRLPRPPPIGPLPRFPDEVAAGRLRPGRFSAFWIETGAMSSSESHNQLELPRFANHFFGFAFSAHATTPRLQPIGTVRITMGSRTWPAQALNWRGAPKMNKMERIYLPTVEQGGLDYANAGALFTRTRRGTINLTVMPWGGATVVGWERTSAGKGTLFSVGRGSPRICGFF